MPSKVDAKASTKQGDIRFKYDSKPEDTCHHDRLKIWIV
jgi:hypothetical protein